MKAKAEYYWAKVLGIRDRQPSLRWDWYDTRVDIIYVVNYETGKHTLVGVSDEYYFGKRGSTHGKTMGSEKLARALFDDDDAGRVRETTRKGGTEFTSKDWRFRGQTNKFNARALNPDGRSVNIDDVMTAFGISNTAMGAKAPGNNVHEQIKHLVDAVGVASGVQGLKEIKLNGGESSSGSEGGSTFEKCDGCDRISQDGTEISSDSAKKVTTSENIKEVPVETWHSTTK